MTNSKNKKNCDSGTIWYVCKFCKRAYQKRKHLVRHKRQFHPNNVQNIVDLASDSTSPQSGQGQHNELNTSSTHHQDGSSPVDDKDQNVKLSTTDFTQNSNYSNFMATFSQTVVQTSDEEEVGGKSDGNPPPPRRLNSDSSFFIDVGTEAANIVTATCPNSEPYFWIEPETQNQGMADNKEHFDKKDDRQVHASSRSLEGPNELDPSSNTNNLKLDLAEDVPGSPFSKISKTDETATAGPKGFRVMSPKLQIFKNDQGKIQHKCRHCNKKLASLAYCKVHEKRHTGQLPFRCHYCSKAFAIRNSRDIHERVHTGEKPFRCGYCTSCFSQASNLNAHVRRHHASHFSF